MRTSLSLLAAAALAAACTASGGSAPSGTPPAVAAQIRRGGEVFAASCARCHGASGQGTEKAPPLVGAGALPLDPRPGQVRATRFRTALDVAAFATQSMPPDAELRARIPAEDWWAVLAFDLSANGVALERPVGPDNAASIVLHP